MNNIGIKARVIFLGTVPALLFAIILIGYIISNIFGILNQSLVDRGKIIATQLAPAAEYGVISGNRQMLQKLVQQALDNEQDLKTVMVVDNQGLVLAYSGQAIPETLISKIMQENLPEYKQARGIIFSAPIHRSLVEIDDFSSLEENTQQLKKDFSPEKIGQIYVELSNQGLQSYKLVFVVKIASIALLGLLLSGWLAWRIGRNITQPIQEIARAVNKVREGVLSQTLVENSSGELKTLQKGFNSMSASLKHAYDVMQDKINDATSMLRHQAQHDDLTGLINRREFEVRLERCLKSAKENNAKHVFCFLDLDQFKLVNDTSGHIAGDELLKQVSVLLAIRMRERDTLARLGGDEFGLLLENCTQIEADQICSAIQRIIRDFRYSHDDKIFNIGVSIGMVIIDDHLDSVSEVIHAADMACMTAKKA